MPLKGSRRQGRPFYVAGLGSSVEAQPLGQIALSATENGEGYSEDWLQRLLFENPDLLPLAEIEPIFAPGIPLCRELPTPAGPIDIAYVSDSGFPTFVECKLWRNPEARREVVGQVLDYAKEISEWSYEQLQTAVQRRRPDDAADLVEIVRRAAPDLDDVAFIDRLSRNLARSRFLLLVVGDGIRESTEAIAAYLQRYAGLHFTFALVELGLHRLPESIGGLIVEPRVLARTVEIERVVVRSEAPGIKLVEPPADAGSSGLGRRVKITEDAFFESVEKADPALPALLRDLFDRCRGLGLAISQGRDSMILHWPDETFGKVNFGTIRSDGTLNTNYIAETAENAGDRSIAERYLEGVAALLPGSSVLREGRPWTWRVVQAGGRPAVRDLFPHSGEWLRLIEHTMDAFQDLKSRKNALRG